MKVLIGTLHCVSVCQKSVGNQQLEFQCLIITRIRILTKEDKRPCHGHQSLITHNTWSQYLYFDNSAHALHICSHPAITSPNLCAQEHKKQAISKNLNNNYSVSSLSSLLVRTNVQQLKIIALLTGPFFMHLKLINKGKLGARMLSNIFTT